MEEKKLLVDVIIPVYKQMCIRDRWYLRIINGIGMKFMTV